MRAALEARRNFSGFFPDTIHHIPNRNLLVFMGIQNSIRKGKLSYNRLGPQKYVLVEAYYKVIISVSRA